MLPQKKNVQSTHFSSYYPLAGAEFFAKYIWRRHAGYDEGSETIGLILNFDERNQINLLTRFAATS